MIELSKPEVIITHESDLDGLVAGVLLQRLARQLFNAHVPLEAHHYHSWRMRDLRENTAWVADLSFEARLDRPHWVVVDHHPTETPPSRAQLLHDLGKSAGLLCYELCRQNGLSSPLLDRLVHLNNVADLFLTEDPDFLLANDYANLVKVYGFWSVHGVIDGDLEKLLDHPLLEVMAVKRRVEDPIGLEWSRRNVVELCPSVGYVDPIVGNNNLILHQLLETRATPFPVLVTLFRRPNGTIIASLRSRNGEALKIAEKLQGGGHPNACGATLPKSVRSYQDAVQYLRQILSGTPRRTEALNSLESIFAEIESRK
ncbi:MAG TPA: DHH family phosphoesterase [Methylomirabilota bacterium]|nr:DHH family phosphoesterase [Methylomirabilota bacterium]